MNFRIFPGGTRVCSHFIATLARVVKVENRHILRTTIAIAQAFRAGHDVSEATDDIKQGQPNRSLSTKDLTAV